MCNITGTFPLRNKLRGTFVWKHSCSLTNRCKYREHKANTRILCTQQKRAKCITRRTILSVLSCLCMCRVMFFCVFFFNWTVFAHLFSVFHHTVVYCQIGKRVSQTDGIWFTCRPMWQCSGLSTMRRNLRTHRNLRGRPQSWRLLEKVLCSAALAGSQIHISVTRFIPHLLL